MLETYIKELQGLLQNKPNVDDLERYRSSPYLQQDELANALFYSLAKKCGQKPHSLSLSQLASGALLLQEGGFFPWRAFPYPKAHAEVGALLASFEEYREIALKMAHFQEAILDHHKKAIASFFQQEKGCFFEELDHATFRFFEALSFEPKDDYTFTDTELGILAKRDLEKTKVLLASGCKTGMGAFLFKDIGILNFGLQLKPVGDCSGFGLSARASQLKMTETSMAYQNRLSAPHSRATGLSWLSDSGYSGVWLSADLKMSEDSFHIECEIEGFRPLTDLAFSFFCKANYCLVSKFQKLNPRSLDRYLGPPQLIELRGNESNLILEPMSGFSQMEIIPLAGDEAFWGADFLVSFSLKNPSISASIHL